MREESGRWLKEAELPAEGASEGKILTVAESIKRLLYCFLIKLVRRWRFS